MRKLPLEYKAIMRRVFLSAVVLIALTILTVFISGGILAWKTSYLDKYLPQSFKEFFGKEISESSPTVTSESSPPQNEDSQKTREDSVKDWRNYTNADAGFSFKYPDDWVSIIQPQGAVVSFASMGGGTSLSAYQNFQGGFEHWSSVETKDYRSGENFLVPVTVMYGEDDPNEVTVFGGPYNADQNISFFYIFNRQENPNGLETFELIMSTLKLF
ncbi:MAG: hypothetical protein WEC39_01450 [Patescibacteria group bacterium]